MRILANIARILVGIEFVFSGFVKVVDPYGTGLKFQEYFEVFAEDLPAFSDLFEFVAGQSQILSLTFCALELILGVALLVNFKMRITAWVVLLLMGFFTFLTFYSAFFNKVTDCGCLGDFLKLEPWHSFWKDVISIAVISIIFLFRKKYNEWAFSLPSAIIATLIAFGIGIYAKRHLPPIDFLAYAEGLSIPEQMKPTGVKPIIEYSFLEKETGSLIKSQEFLMDTTVYKYESSEILNQSELTPKITDYSVGGENGEDMTAYSLEGNKILVALKKLKGIDNESLTKIKDLNAQNIAEVMIISSLLSEDLKPFLASAGINNNIYSIDEKVLKTMARTNPSVILLMDGVVKKKWSYIDIPSTQEITEIIKNTK